LALQPKRIRTDGETQASLVNTLTTTRYAGTLTGRTDAVSSVAFSHDGHTLTTTRGDRTVQLWDLAELEIVAGMRPSAPARLPIAASTWARYVYGLPYQNTCPG
jgi:WD40 repeat protein